MKKAEGGKIEALKAGALAALLAALPLCREAAAADWPMFRGNPARTGASAEQAAPPFSAAWTFQAGGGILSSPAVFGGGVYFGARDGYIYALDARTGAELWRFRTLNWVDSSPAVSSSAVYAASLDGHLYAVDRLTGAPLWRVNLGAPSSSSPLLYGGRIYVGTALPENRLKVYDAATGAPLGSLQAAQPVDSAPAAYGDRIYFGANDGYVYALDRASLLPPAGWSHRPSAGSFRLNAAAVAGGEIYSLPGHDDKKAYALDAASGNELRRSAEYEAARSWQTFASPAVAGSRLYFTGAIGAPDEYTAAGDNYLSAVDTGTLVSVWASSPSLGGIADMGLLSSPALAGELLFAGTADSRLLVFSSAGVQAASLALSSAAYSSPAVADGFVYIGDMAGRLSAFAAGRAAALSSPAEGDVVNGVVYVRGYAANPSLAGYELHYSTGGEPEVWHLVVSSATATAVYGGELAAWDTSVLQNGAYALRLTVLEGGSPPYANAALTNVRVNSVPLPPSGLAAADVPGDGGNALALSWTASPTPGVTAYRVYRASDDAPDFALLASTAPSPLHYTDASAATGSTFTYTVRAWDGWLESADSVQASSFSVNDTGDLTAPSAVTDLAAVPGYAPGQVLLTWTAPGNDGILGQASHYVIKYSTSPAFAASFDAAAVSSVTRPTDGPAGTLESAEIPWLLAGVTCYFALKAYDAALNPGGQSNTAAAYASYDTLPPLPPSALTVADTPGDEGGSLTLSWTPSPDDGAGTGDVYGYRVYRRLLNAAYVSTAPYAEVGRGVYSYRDQAAAENVRHFYAVAAFDSTLNSALTGEAYGVSADNYRFVDASQGGYVRLPDGARVDIAAGGVSQNDGIMFTRVDPATYVPLARVRAAQGANPTGVVYEVKFKNAATRLTGRAVLSLPYTPADVAGMDPENLRLYTLSGGSWVMLNTSAVDAANRRVSAEVNSFSIFRIMEYVPAGSVLDSAEVYSYPNPATGDTVTFKFKLAYKSHVRISVYNVAGEKVASFERADCPAGQASEIVWNVRKIASGVYIFRLEAASSAGTKSVTKRFAIAH